jgi:outer membrane receptor protein involved in Fe transport
VISQGVEVEAMLNLYDGVYATIGGTYAPARYGNSHKFSDELRGNIITQAPRFQSNASIDVEQPLLDTSWMWLVGSNLSYRSGMNTSSDLGREKYVGPVWLWNGQIGLRTPSERWTAWLWGENLTNKRYMTVGFNSVFQTGSVSAFTNTPRLYGVKLEYAY